MNQLIKCGILKLKIKKIGIRMQINTGMYNNNLLKNAEPTINGVLGGFG